MKYIIIGLIFFFNLQLCKAQGDEIRLNVDSFSKLARVKADAVLNSLDSLKSNSLLYSISNEQYLIIHKDEPRYQQLFIQTDSLGRVKVKRHVPVTKRNVYLLNKAFDTINYQSGFITAVPNAVIVQGNPSYFVLKDKDEMRYGEFYLSVLTKPSPLPLDIYNYLFITLLREASGH